MKSIGKPRKHRLYEIGEIIDDMQVLERYYKGSTIYFKVKCLKCGREKELKHALLYQHSGTKHKWCAKSFHLAKMNQRFHRIWRAIRYRTTNPHDIHYSYYGGRGISSEAFKDFADFFDTMYSSYCEAAKQYDEKSLSIDRIDCNGDYTPENCRWIPITEQAGNTRRNRRFNAISPSGEVFEEKNQAAFAREHNIPHCWIKRALYEKKPNHGWTFKYIDPPYQK